MSKLSNYGTAVFVIVTSVVVGVGFSPPRSVNLPFCHLGLLKGRSVGQLFCLEQMRNVRLMQVSLMNEQV